MRILGKAEIVARLDKQAALEAVRASLIAQSRGEASSDLIHLAFPEAHGDAHVKTGHARGASVFVVKVATGFYDNPSRGLPSSNGAILVFSARTGQPLALLQDEGWLTDLRTGLAGALATLRLWPRGATRLAIVGAGVQARMQLEGLRIAAPDLACDVAVWARAPDRAAAFARDVAPLGFPVHVAPSLETLCRQAEIIVTTTPATAPLVRDAWVGANAHVTAIGADAPGKQEIETALSARAALRAADSAAQSLSHGEFSHALAAGVLSGADVVELGALLAGDTPKPDGLTIADLTGLGAEDAAVAAALLERM